MKAASPALQELLAGKQFAIADLFTITLRDGTELHYTSCDIDLEYSGDTYLANVLKIQRGPITQSVGVEVDAVELTIQAGTSDTIQGLPIPAFVRNGGFDGARVLIQRAFMGDQTGPQVTIIVADTYVMRGETSLVTFVWSEVITGFTLADVTADNGTLSGLTTSDNITFTATFTPTGTEIVDTTNVVTVDLEGVQDSSGNLGVGSATSNNYTVNTSYWVQRGSVLTASDAESSDVFGAMIALSNNGLVLAVGASQWEGAVSNQGAVYIYDWTGTSWVQRGSVLTESPAGVDHKFSSVSLSADGTVLAVGVHGYSSSFGCVYIYDWNGSSWVQRGSVLTPSDAGSSGGQQFGFYISLSANGNIMAIGANRRSSDTGGVYIYDRSGSSWVQRGAVLTASDAAAEDSFSAVALSGDGTILAIGAWGWEGAVSNQGAVYIYDWTGSSWAQRGSVLTASDAASGDQYGYNVAISDDGLVLAVGARSFNGKGGVYIYDWSGSFWVQRGAVLTASDAAANDLYGFSVAFNSDATILVVSAVLWEGAASDQGGVYIYDSTL
jgi:hypothetical protein